MLGFKDPTNDPDDGRTKLLQLIVDEAKPVDIKIQKTDEIFKEKEEL